MRSIVVTLLVCACGTVSENDGTGPEVAVQYSPTEVRSGLPGLDTILWTDLGVATTGDPVRGLLSLPVKDGDALEAAVQRMYDPSAADFRRYLTAAEWNAAYAPGEDELAAVTDWLGRSGLEVTFVSSNRLLVVFEGTVGEFNAAFGTTLHALSKGSALTDRTYGAPGPLVVPLFFARHLDAVLAADLPASTDPLPGEAGEVTIGLPGTPSLALTPAQVANAYGLKALHDAGFRGQGQRLGVVVGAGFKLKDEQSFWQSFGVTRADPIVVTLQEPIATRYIETTIDIAWSGALAPEADLVVYQGPDSRDAVLLYTFTEAIARGEVGVITDSFAHRETAVTRPVRDQYNVAAVAAASMGITVVSASGDSGKTDIPSSSPYVTATGGTTVQVEDDGTLISETGWSASGSGEALSFMRPDWQAEVAPADRRCVVDVALNSGRSYWCYLFGDWARYYGTSFASPVFAAAMTIVNQKRAADGKPAAGWLNPALYTDAAVQATFRDVLSGATGDHPCGPGWDFPTGWGAPNAAGLAEALP